MVIKIGGLAFDSDNSFAELAHDLKTLTGTSPVIVHGGGAEISRELKAAKREPVFVDGLRITTQEDMEIVENVLSEKVNKRIADALGRKNLKCQRMSGKTGGLLIVEPLTRNGRDMGFVGKIIQVNPDCIFAALVDGFIPVISPVSADINGVSFNVNADTAAGAIAIALGSSDLFYFTDVPGVQVNGKPLVSLAIDKARNLIKEGIIYGGMIAKLESAFSAIEKGVNRVHIAKWQGSGTCAKILNNIPGNGTTIHD